MKDSDLEELFIHWVSSYDPDNEFPEMEHYPEFLDIIEWIKTSAREEKL